MSIDATRQDRLAQHWESEMSGLLVLLVLFAVIALAMYAGHLVTRRKIADLRSRGIYPAEGKEQPADVLNLLAHGEKVMAIRCYRSIHKVSLKEAKMEVEKLADNEA